MAAKKVVATESINETEITASDVPQEAAPIYIPDTPMQEEVVEKPESDEILFLRRILQIQNEGGFGRHLNGIINERIKSLKV